MRTLTTEQFRTLLEAFGDSDASGAMKSGLDALRQLGIVEHQGARDPWLSVEHAKSRVVLSSESQFDENSTAVVRQLVLTALERVDENRRTKLAEERLEMLSSASFEGIMIHVDGNIIDANKRLAELLGCAYEDVFGDWSFRNCIAPEDLSDVHQRMASGYEGAYVITGVRKDGTRFRAELQSKQGKLGTRPVRVAAVRDVTERERIHRLLLESETRLRDLAGAAFDLTVLSRNGVIVGASGPLLEKLGLAAEDTIGRPLLDFVAPSSRPMAAQVIAEGRTGGYRNVVIGRSGVPVPVEIIAVNSTLDGRAIRVAGVRDLSELERQNEERRTLQAQVERAQRLDSLGVLAGGIAHDFNNLLVGIIGNADLVLAETTVPEHKEALEAVLAAGQRAGSLTTRMLAYAGRGELAERRPVDLADQVGQLQVLLAASISKKAQIEVSIDADCTVLADPTTLSQVLMNLMTNASDALGESPGNIRVRGRRVSSVGAEWDTALGAPIRPGQWVLVEVQDDGSGMDEPTLARAFDPFYSTKERGHGLGLAACLGILTALGGAIRVESSKGVGTHFFVLLPASTAVSELPRAPSAVETPPCAVLIVDDEPIVRSQMRRVLELRGFSVQDAVDGTSALARLEQHRFDLMIVDMTMPDMDGAELAKAVRARGASVPIVLTSGYFTADAERRLDPGSFQAVLKKPYVISELMEAIARARAQA